jgi:hypothetical protein
MGQTNDKEHCSDELQARYANYFKVGHNAFEFLLDFGQFFPETEHAQFHTRIVLSPAYAKELRSILNGSVDQYEQNFGIIPEHEE